MQNQCYNPGMAALIPGRTDSLNFGRRLRLFRKRHGLTQAELGAIVSVDQTTVSGWERGAEQPRDWYIHADTIADALNVPVSALTGEESDHERAVRVAEEALDYATATPRSEEAMAVPPRPGAETYLQMIRRHFPAATPEQFQEIQRQVEAFMAHNIQEMRAINRIGDTILQLAKERTGEGGDEDDGEDTTERKPFRPEPEEFHGERVKAVLRAN